MMKKSVFRALVSVLVGVFTTLGALGADQTKGYEGADLPTAPDMSGTVVNVTAANAQYTLDGAYGSIDGKTINFTESLSTALVLGRPTKYAGSNTTYRHGSYDNAAMSYTDYISYKSQSGSVEYSYYTRAIAGVTFTANEGVTLAGLATCGGKHIYGTTTVPIYDYVIDNSTWCYDTNYGYYMTLTLTNLKFDGVSFTKQVNMDTSSDATVYDGITFKNCSFTTGGTAASNGAAIHYYNENNNGNVKNLVVEKCTFKNCYQGVYTSNVRNITVKDSDFDTTGHNAVAVQSGSCTVNHGAVVITGNTFKGIGDRVIRFNNVGADTQITIQNNTVTDDGLSTQECIKATSLADGVTYEVSGNDWSGYKTAYNTELQDAVATTYVAQIGTTKYETLADAVAAATAGQTVEILVADTYTLPNLPLNITIKGNVDGVVFDATGAYGTSICSVPNGCTFNNVTFNLGQNDYHGFQHAGTINMTNCTLNGKLFSYGVMNFTGCTFNQTASDYCMWCYGTDATYTGCTFNTVGKALNVYCENNSTAYNITVSGCTFNSTKLYKPAINVKETCGSTMLKYNVTITDCTIGTPDFYPTADTYDATAKCYVISPLVQVDDRNTGATESGITVTLQTTDPDTKEVTATVAYPVANPVAQIGETKYNTFAEALAAYQALSAADRANATITVLNYDAEKMTAPAGCVFATAGSTTTLVPNFCEDGNGVYHIYNLAGMKEFRDQANTESLNGQNSSTGHTKVVLDADIDLGNEEWTPIVMSCVDFDGQNHTIKNLKVTTEARNVGLFGTASISTVKNLTVDTATVTGINHVAVIAGDGLCGHFINCTVKNATVTTSVKDNDDGDKAGAICGYLSGESDAEATNCTVENCKVYGYRDIGGLVGYANGTASVTGNTVKNTTVYCDLINNENYKNYTTEAAHDANKIIGETSSNATVSANTATNVKVIFLKPTKFTFGITGYDPDSNEPVSVEAQVYPDYGFKVTLPTAGYDQLGANKATVTMTMTDVASLGVSGTRSYTKTVETGVTGVSVSLSAFLENTYGFQGTTVPVTITDKTGATDVTKKFTYAISAITDDQIVGTPSSEADARAAWQLLTSQVTAGTKTEDDTHFLFKKDSYLQIGNERLTFTKDFDFLKGGLSVETLFDDIAAAVAISSKDADGNAWATRADTYKATLYLPAGSTLAVSQSAAALKSDMTLVVDASAAYTEGNELTGVVSGMKTQLDKLEGSNKTKVAILLLVRMFDEVVGLVDAADNVPVSVMFSKSQYFVLPEENDRVADVTFPRSWVDETYPGKTDAEVVEALMTEDPNGNLAWKNLVMGLDASTKLTGKFISAEGSTTTTPKTTITSTVTLSPVQSSGVTVTYVLQSSTDAETWTDEARGSTASFPISLTHENTKYYRIKATFTPTTAQ